MLQAKRVWKPDLQMSHGHGQAILKEVEWGGLGRNGVDLWLLLLISLLLFFLVLVLSWGGLLSIMLVMVERHDSAAARQTLLMLLLMNYESGVHSSHHVCSTISVQVQVQVRVHDASC